MVTCMRNKGQSNLAKGDTDRLIMSYAKEIVPIKLLHVYSPSGSTGRKVGAGVHLRPPFWRKGGRRVISGDTIRKSDGGCLYILL